MIDDEEKRLYLELSTCLQRERCYFGAFAFQQSLVIKKCFLCQTCLFWGLPRKGQFCDIFGRAHIFLFRYCTVLHVPRYDTLCRILCKNSIAVINSMRRDRVCCQFFRQFAGRCSSGRASSPFWYTSRPLLRGSSST